MALQFCRRISQFNISFYRTKRSESKWFLLHMIRIFFFFFFSWSNRNILFFVCLKVFLHPDFLTLSESMVNQIMTRNLDVPEIRKFEAMLRWATNKSKLKPDPEQEFKHIMDRLKKDIDLMKIAPQDLIRVRNTSIFRQFLVFRA